jgi:DHA2 family methylenomycin A resistance protein-like MFS transporter
MSGISFLMPLYLTDIHNASASTVGAVLAVQAGTLFLVSRAGGQIADRWGSRLPTAVSMLGLVGVMVALALLPASAPLWIIFVAVAVHGLIIGLSLAPLHRSAMQGVDEAATGMAAGLYSMLRFAGQILGTALAGVLLQQGLDRLLPPLAAYQSVFWLHVAIALVATIAGLGIRERQVA